MDRKVVVMGVVAATLAVAAFSGVARSAEQPLFSKDRASLAFGLDYSFYQRAGSEPLPTFKKEWKPGIFGAYVLTPHLTLTGSGKLPLDNKLPEWAIGVRTVLWRGND